MSRRTMPYHRRYQQDALQGYLMLSLEERGAYTTILDLIYDAGGPISDNRRMLAGYLQCSIRKANAMVAALLEKGKIYLTRDGKISNRRCEMEIASSLEISRKRAEVAAKPQRKQREIEKKPNENKPSREQLQRVCAVIPVPEPDIITSTVEEEDTPAPFDASPCAAGVPVRREFLPRGRAAPISARLAALASTASDGPPIEIAGERLLAALDRQAFHRFAAQPGKPRGVPAR